MKLKNKLNRVLHDRGLAEGEVALVARLDQGHLNRIKNGRVKPTLVTALRISQALGIPVQQLFWLEGTDGGASAIGADAAAESANVAHA